jgi:hypothetical protein
MGKIVGMTAGFIIGTLIRFTLFTVAVWASIVVLNNLGLL